MSTSQVPSTSDAAGPSTSSAAPARIDLSLDRIKRLLTSLGSPQDLFPAIHIAGTNGKGSTSAYLDALLRSVMGLSTGRFNSPHLVEERDCCTVNGQMIDAETWSAARRRVNEVDQKEGLGSTPFELLVARTFTSFASLPVHRRPSVLLIEVGLGGRLDATNVLQPHNVLASVICPVDKDHEALLGSELAQIAREKAGIIQPGGLCVIADQRRAAAGSATDTGAADIDSTSIRESAQEAQMLGPEAGEVLDAIRHVALEKGARIVKGYVPWHALHAGSIVHADADPSGSSSSSKTRRRPLARTSIRYCPTLFPSVQPSTPTHFLARTGDPVLPGPQPFLLPPTRAALTGACTALQTLFSIARDEPRSAFVGTTGVGGDVHEEIKLQIAFAMRDDRETSARIQEALGAVKWEGRCAWVQALVPQKQEAEEQTTAEGEEPQAEGQRAGSIELLVDGAHNPSSAKALRAYIDLCLPSDTSSSTTTITWIMAFSQGKDIKGMLAELLACTKASTSTSGAAELSNGLAELSIEQATAARRVRHRIAFLPFSTPVEGMPWVQPADARSCVAQAKELAALPLSGGEALGKREEVLEIEAFGSLDETLRWAAGFALAARHEGAESEEGREEHMTVLCGSLYLVGDLYRTLRAQI